MILKNAFMTAAVSEALTAYALGEVPVGAVVVRGGTIIARAHNLREAKRDALAHAEILAIQAACRAKGDWRLDDCDLYVTLEPCAMCAGAIRQARLRRLYFGAYDPAYGCVVSAARYLDKPAALHKTEYYCGIMEETCSALITAFFNERRQG